MKDELLPPEHHVSRYCGYTTLAPDGRPSLTAFFLGSHDFVSVNWLELTGFTGRAEQLEAVRKAAAAKKLKYRSQGKLAVLNVGSVKRHVHAATKQQLVISHQPELPDDPTHSGIFYPLGEPSFHEFLASRIAESVSETHPAKL